MSQSSLNILNMSRTLFRGAINAALQALASKSSGSAEPDETYPFMEWADTTSGLLKQRNAADTDWVVVGKLGANYLGLPEVPTHAATEKTTPVDADEFSLCDSAASWSLKKLTWANLKSTIFGGSVLLTSGASGLGFGTGAGGNVTQETSKSTAVALNKPCGQITMHNASLASNTAVGFTFNNSLLSATDILNVQISSGVSDPSSYTLQAAGGTAGLRGIFLKNTSTGPLSEAVVINFSISKVVTS